MKLVSFDIRSPLPQNWRDLVTPRQQERAKKFLHDEDRLRCLGAGILLAQELGISSDDDIAFGPYGKPFLRDNRAHYNLSHSGNLVVLAVSDQPVGVDVEQIRQFSGIDEIALKCFTPEEIEWLKIQSGEEAFFRLWTGKEGLMKATGKGLSLDPASFSILPIENGIHFFEGRKWNLSWLFIEDHIVCTVEFEPS